LLRFGGADGVLDMGALKPDITTLSRCKLRR
jgi:hypothetical protein